MVGRSGAMSSSSASRVRGERNLPPSGCARDQLSQSKRDQQADDTQGELAPFVGEPPPTPEGESEADERSA
jgi:hypothetical protein